MVRQELDVSSSLARGIHDVRFTGLDSILLRILTQLLSIYISLLCLHYIRTFLWIGRFYRLGTKPPVGMQLDMFCLIRLFSIHTVHAAGVLAIYH